MSIDPELSRRLQERSRLTAANMPLTGRWCMKRVLLRLRIHFLEQAVRMGGRFRPLVEL